MGEALVGGILAGYGIAIPVGAIAVLIVGTGMRCGFACGASAGAGAATADLLYAMIAALAGTAAARALEPWALPIRIISGSVLIALALIGLARARRPIPPREPVPIRRGELALTYGRFLGLTVINPMTVVYFGSMVLGSRAGQDPAPAEAAVFAAAAFAASLSWQLVLAAVGALAGRNLPAGFRAGTAVAGNLIILALAVRIIL